MKQKASPLYIQALRHGIAAILVVVPFYTVLSIWAASRLKHLDFFKSWKEMMLVAMAAIVAGFLITHGKYAAKVFKNNLVLLMVAYMVLVIIMGIYGLSTNRVSDSAAIYGWLIDLRVFGIFLVSLLTFHLSQQFNLKPFPWRKIILVPAICVIIFGFLQVVALPHDFLNHFGYSLSTTAPYETVDNQPGLIRIQSTLRGPNPLGAYLVIVITVLVSEFMRSKDRRYKAFLALLGLLGLFDLYNTYSRSAEIGLVLALGALVFVHNRALIHKFRWHLTIAGAALVLLLGVAAAKHNYLVQNVIFHSSNKSTSAVSSNSQRADAMQTALKDIIHHPLGSGVGSAGAASRRNTKGPVKIAENYYLQIGQELGILGLILFLSINVVIAVKLWRQRHDELTAVLLASLVGLAFANLLYHAWSDDALAYIWWSLAGLALAPAILTTEHKRHGKKQKTA